MPRAGHLVVKDGGTSVATASVNFRSLFFAPDSSCFSSASGRRATGDSGRGAACLRRSSQRVAALVHRVSAPLLFSLLAGRQLTVRGDRQRTGAAVTCQRRRHEGGSGPGPETERTPGLPVLVRQLEPVRDAARLLRGRQGRADMGTRR